MCEPFCLSSRLPTRTTFSLERSAQRGGVGGPIDGWGIAFHEGHDVRLYKEPEPAADSQWLRFIRHRQLSSRLGLSHIRRATRGEVSLANTQPLVRELGGRMHVFAHNGRLDGIERHSAQTRRFNPVGETDSDLAFCILLERLNPLWSGGRVPSVEERNAVVARFAADMRALGPANFLYTDGEALFVHGHRRIQQNSTIAPRPVVPLARMQRRCRRVGASRRHDRRRRTASTDYASVPLTDEPWRPLGEGEIRAVSSGQVLASVAPARGPSIR